MTPGRAMTASATATVATAALAGALLLLAACGAGRSSEPGNARQAAGDTLEGTVRQVGSTPFTRTVVEGDTAGVTVTGPLAGELSRLVGARVRVAGSPVEGETPGPTLRVESYEVLSVDGERPRVGILRHAAGEGYRLETDAGDLALRAVPAGLGGVVGGKVWLVLGPEGGVQRYGVLREP